VLSGGLHPFLTPAVLIEYTPPALLTFVVGGLLGIVGQSGDLMISALKRKAQVKDTGAIVPGHGGMLDRIDALLLIVLPYLCFVLYILPS
jgi:phosphatidate cytidylyltransferase